MVLRINARPTRPRGTHTREEWEKWVEICISNDHILTSKEADFVEDMSLKLQGDNTYYLTESQEQWLQKIYDTVCEMEGL